MALPDIISKGVSFSDLEPISAGRLKSYEDHESMIVSCASELRRDFANQRTGALPQGDTRVFVSMIEADTDFHDLVKYDEATGRVYHSTHYKSVDDIKIGILRRGGVYGLNISKQSRDDILGLVLSRPGNTLNSIKMWAQKMATYTPKSDPLPKLLEYFKYSSPDDVEKYNKFWSLFFRSASTHIVSSYLGAPYPSEIVPVLVGRQGIGKTRFCEYLATSPDMYVDLGNKHAALGSPDSLRLISGKVVAELGEMSIWRKTDAESVKSFVTQKVDSWVPKYKESPVEFKRSCFFIGNSNSESFLRDFTGNRRWFPVHVDQISPDLFDNERLIREVWGWYLEYAQDLIMKGDYREIQVDKELTEFFEEKRSNAIDTGNDGDFLKEVIMGIELAALDTIKPQEEWIWISPKAVASAYFGEASRANRQFKDILSKVCSDLGYEVSVCHKKAKAVYREHRISYAKAKERHSEELPIKTSPIIVPIEKTLPDITIRDDIF